MLIYDTLSGEKKPLPETGGKPLRLFVCGPTVYGYIHIGNARTYAAFDLIVRYLRSQKIKVQYLQNITDIDDKIIKRAQEEKKHVKAIANFYARAYKQDMRALDIASVNKYAPATRYVRQIVKQVRALVEKGLAYKIDGEGYYFDISKFPDYGKLSRRTSEQAEDSISRIDESINKRNKGDFVLWKFSSPEVSKKTGEPVWKTPLGAGRPGWHIEDTAITEYFFGPQYDLHGGGIDLKFPHHEAEIAQQETASGKKPMVGIWMHIGTLLVGGVKMSKSAGNFITVRDFLKKYPPEIFRLLVAEHHYRSPIDYSDELAEQTKNSLWTIKQFVGRLRLIKNKIGKNTNAERLIAEGEKKFQAAMADDFNTPEALAAIFGVINSSNPQIWDLSKNDAKKLENWVLATLKTLGVALKFGQIPLKIRFLARRRELSRSNKQFTQSDALRKELEGLGYIVEDTVLGLLVLRKF